MADNRKRENKFKGVMWDYYMTNREITKAYNEEYKKQPKNLKWTRNEKVYLGVCVLGAIGLIIRFIVL
ncbi:MAG: hypothetical protein FWG42_00825 [Clostridiales bacterium]|nr:hypothetical protein [Clostridiales bacterium]